MPDLPSKVTAHPFRTQRPEAPPPRAASDIEYVELAATTNFTFLTGASHPDEMVQQAGALGHAAAAITDTNTLAGIVRAHVAAKEAGIPLVIGARIALAEPEGISLLLYPTDRPAYSRLCRLLTLGKRRAEKGDCILALHDVLDHHEGMLAILEPELSDHETGGRSQDPLDESFLDLLRGLRSVFDDDRLSLAASCPYGPDDQTRLRQLADLGACAGVPLVATNNALYHHPSRRPLQDVITCIREGCAIDEAGLRLRANAERHLKPPEEMARLFADYPGAIRRTVQVARRAAFTLDQLRYEYPDETTPPGMTPIAYLRQLCREGARRRYGAAPPPKTTAALERELALIDELGYAPYFLTAHEIVSFARAQGILCQGRGAAANSAVCYCIGVTEVDPASVDLLFERFVSPERDEPPDIDIDFEHERREEVIQHIYQRYGRDRAALTAEVISYRGRSAVREVGKAMGLSLDAVDTLAKNLDYWSTGADPRSMREAGFDPRDPTIRRIIALTNQLVGFPRHLSQHVGGFVITKSPLHDLVPIENAAMIDRTVIEWDKDDIDAMGMLKVDCLGLGMLTCVAKALSMVGGSAQAQSDEKAQSTKLKAQIRKQPSAQPVQSLDPPPTPLPPSAPLCAPSAISAFMPSRPCSAASPVDVLDAYRAIAANLADPTVYDAICRADTIGVFQIESRAQMSMLPRLRPREFYDLVIEVAIVRPGPIQGKMVHPYLRRRRGEEPVPDFPPDVQAILGKTLGVPLFQEQAMELAIVAGGFTPGEADKLRRAMAAWKRKGDQIERFGDKLIRGMLQRGYTRDFAERCFEQIKGFSEYGFPQAHAASFALIVYVSAWLKVYHPAAFAAALINSQPMGFYAPAQIVRDAQDHDVEVRQVDVNESGWDCSLEEGTPNCNRRQNAEFAERAQRPQSQIECACPEPEGQRCELALAAIPPAQRASLQPRRGDRSLAPGAASEASKPGVTAPGYPKSPGGAKEAPAARQFTALPEGRSPSGLPLPRPAGEGRGEGYHAYRPSQASSHNQSPNEPEPLCAHLRLPSIASPPALRLGTRLVKGLGEAEGRAIEAAVRCRGPFKSVEALWRASGVRVRALRALAQADAFASMGLDRQAALWQVRRLRDDPLPLFDSAPRADLADRDEGASALPRAAPWRQVNFDYSATGLSLKAHPVSFVRPELARREVICAAELADPDRCPTGRRIAVAGIVLLRQRPGTAGGIIFMTLEDETGVANLIVRPHIFDRCRKAARTSVVLIARGRVERDGEVVHLLADHLETADALSPDLHSPARNFH